MKFLKSLAAITLLSFSVAAAPTRPRDGGNPSADGTSFVVSGTKGYLAGTNAYWIGFLTNNDDIDTVMSQLQQSELKVLRIWGFNTVNSTPSDGTVWYQGLIPGSDPAINTGADGLERQVLLIQLYSAI
jgi:mannan endo-1,4-beta-mannosidase